jgi:hypothetical protein
MLRYLSAAFLGPPQARAAHRQVLSRQHDIATGIEALLAACPPAGADDDEAPIFLLSAGWRSGSTLLQRLLMSDKSVLIWGEPYDECGLIQAMAASVRAFRPGWPRADYYYDGTPIGQLSGNWVANLFPSPESLRDAHRALFDTLFAQPARTAGAERWGIKEVRLGAEHCRYLRWLYPKARFLFLYRNPLDAYRSYCSYGRNWYDTYPDRPVFTPRAFGAHWRHLMAGFLRDADELGALRIRYEDLVGGKAHLDEIEAYLGIRIDRDILKVKVRNSDNVKAPALAGVEKTKVSGLEKWLLRRAVSPLAEELGYRW